MIYPEQYRKSVRSHIRIPDGTKVIARQAFWSSCIEEVRIPDSVTCIGDRAFENCRYLRSVTFPETGVTFLGSDLFSGCEQLEYVRLPEDLRVIPSGMFRGCNNLRPPFIIPRTVCCIEDEAFCHARCVTSIPDRVSYIGRAAFRGAKMLDTLHLSIHCLGDYAFAGTNVVRVRLPLCYRLHEIPVGAFQGCRSLRQIWFPHRMGSIGREAFRECVSLESVVIPSAVRHVGSRCFYGCTSLRRVGLWQNTRVEEDTFHGCPFQTAREVPEEPAAPDWPESVVPPVSGPPMEEVRVLWF